jgi:hypothetical protein
MPTNRAVNPLLLSLALLVGAMAITPPDSEGAIVICKRRSRIKLREDACKKKETLVDAAELGVTGPPGPAGPAGPGAIWAFVDADGTIVAQSGGVSIAFAGSADGFSGLYVLDFGTGLTGKAVQVTTTGTGTDPTTRGSPLGGICAGAQGTFMVACSMIPGLLDDEHVWVATYAKDNGVEEDHAFYVSVF